MRPNPSSIGTLAYLIVLTAFMQPSHSNAQAPLVTRAAPYNEPNLPTSPPGQRARISDQESSARVGVSDQAISDRAINDRAWTSTTPAPLPSASSLPPLPGSSMANGSSMASGATAPQTLPAARQSSAQLVSPVSGTTATQGQVLQAQYTSSDAMPPAALRNSGSKPVSLATSQAGLGDNSSNSPSTDPADTSGSSRPLKPRSQSSDLASSPGRSTSTVQMIVSVISSLLIVIALLLGAAWCYRKAAPSINGSLPKDAVHMLGRTAIAPRQQLMIIRFGSKLLLVSNLQGEVRTLSEIDDPLEVDRIAGLCESAQAGSISHSFRTVLHNLGGASE